MRSFRSHCLVIYYGKILNYLLREDPVNYVKRKFKSISNAAPAADAADAEAAQLTLPPAQPPAQPAAAAAEEAGEVA